MPTDAFEETANSTLASHSQLKSALPTAVAQLRLLLAVLPSSDAARQVRPRPRGQPPLPSAEAMRRAADLVAAAASLMPAAQSQVAAHSPTAAWCNLRHAAWQRSALCSVPCAWLLLPAVKSLCGLMSAEGACMSLGSCSRSLAACRGCSARQACAGGIDPASWRGCCCPAAKHPKAASRVQCRVIHAPGSLSRTGISDRGGS